MLRTGTWAQQMFARRFQGLVCTISCHAILMKCNFSCYDLVVVVVVMLLPLIYCYITTAWQKRIQVCMHVYMRACMCSIWMSCMYFITSDSSKCPSGSDNDNKFITLQPHMTTWLSMRNSLVCVSLVSVDTGRRHWCNGSRHLPLVCDKLVRTHTILVSHWKNTVTVIQVGSRSRYTYFSNDERNAGTLSVKGIGCSLFFIGCHDDVAYINVPWPWP